MKIALVHELLTIRGGAERVLKLLANTYPEAPIYTLLYNEEKLGDWFPKERVQTSHLQTYASWLGYNHHLYLPFFPRAVEAWDFSQFDVVLSSSSAFSHGIITNSNPRHISYIHSPARYLWDRTHDVQAQAGTGLLGPLKRWYLQHMFHRLRVWNYEAAYRADTLLAASQTVSKRIESYWRQESTVVYPPIDDFWLDQKSDIRPAYRQGRHQKSDDSFFLIVSTLVPYKRIDLAIEACNQLALPLKIVGEGPYKKRLETMAGPTVEFLGYQDRHAIADLYKNAQATLFPGDEDFGLVPLESMACGTPVIAYRSGGALETVIEGKTGTFFDQPTAESLATVLQTFKKDQYKPAFCHARAEEFSSKKFLDAIEKQLTVNN